MAREPQTSVREPLVLGDLLAGLQALVVLAGPLLVMVFCVVHTVQVQDIVRTLQPLLSAQERLDIWSLITDPFLLLRAAGISIAFTGALVGVTIVGVVGWRLSDWLLERRQGRRSSRRYAALADADVVPTDAWSHDRPVADPPGYEREPVAEVPIPPELL